MKARDLAALAALGIAGKMAYDKFGNKAAPGKASPVYDNDAPTQKEQAVYDYDTPAQKAQAVYDYDTPAQKAQAAYDYDTPVQKQKAAPIYDNDTPSVAKNASKKATAVASRSLDSTGGPSRYNRETSSSITPPVVADYSNEGHSSQAPVTLDRLNEANGAASESARQTDALAVGSRANQAAYLQAKRADQMAAAASPSARATDALAVSSRANQAAYKQAQLAKQAANAQAQARMARQGSPMAASRANAGRPGFDEAGNPIAMRSMAGQRGYDEAGNPMKRGGVVKMAKGGAVKAAKPSGASRGDGIAQRGRTRGKYL
jgi:hypothetical protein